MVRNGDSPHCLGGSGDVSGALMRRSSGFVRAAARVARSVATRTRTMVIGGH